MSTPTTAAGRALLNDFMTGSGMLNRIPPRGSVAEQILAIEAEAAALDVERLARALQETILTTPDQFMGPGMGAYREYWPNLTLAERRAVLSDARALAAAYAMLPDTRMVDR